jgi:hypothetical protein
MVFRVNHLDCSACILYRSVNAILFGCRFEHSLCPVIGWLLGLLLLHGGCGGTGTEKVFVSVGSLLLTLSL